MSYQQFSPSPGLAPYIDAYWTLTGKNAKTVAEKIMPDGCVDIILNLGEDVLTGDSDLRMKNRYTYLVGTMTRYKQIVRWGDTNLVGIRFKPGAFSFFYKYASLHEIIDKTVEFDGKLIPEIYESTKDLAGLLNRYFTDRFSLSYPGQSLVAVIADVKHLKGQVTVEALGKRNFISPRQLERLFKLHVGNSPKEFINFVRYQSAIEKIRDNPARKSLLDIAFESGYYDHAHLSNEVRRYAGLPPSEL